MGNGIEALVARRIRRALEYGPEHVAGRGTLHALLAQLGPSGRGSLDGIVSRGDAGRAAAGA